MFCGHIFQHDPSVKFIYRLFQYFDTLECFVLFFIACYMFIISFSITHLAPPLFLSKAFFLSEILFFSEMFL